MRFEIRFGKERLNTPSGLAITGLLIGKTDFKRRIDMIKLKDNANPSIRNSDVAVSYIGLLCQGKNDFDDIREMQEDTEFYEYTLGIRKIPSSETLRQRLDMAGRKLRRSILEENVKMIRKAKADITPCEGTALVPLDIDVSPFDNSDTKKEGVSYTYKGFAGYAPIFAYLGEEGYIVNSELREGSEHCQSGAFMFLKESLLLAKRLTGKGILVRMDAGNDCLDNLKLCYAEETASDFIVKRNLRRESAESWLETAVNDSNARCEQKDGRKVYTGSVYRHIRQLERDVRIVYKVTERTVSPDGQMMLMPEVEAQTWWTSLEDIEDEVIRLYKAHGTCEQFHSELKTDMDLERLPSGKFDTNALVLELAMMAYNILRIIGQESLKKDDVAIRKGVKRRRIRTVIQNLISLASHVVTHARQVCLNLGRSNIWRFAFKRIYEAFA